MSDLDEDVPDKLDVTDFPRVDEAENAGVGFAVLHAGRLPIHSIDAIVGANLGPVPARLSTSDRRSQTHNSFPPTRSYTLDFVKGRTRLSC